MFGALDLPIEINAPPGGIRDQAGDAYRAGAASKGLGPLQLVAPCTHDTGSAVAAVRRRTSGRLP